jgi:hypothetical protein
MMPKFFESAKPFIETNKPNDAQSKTKHYTTLEQDAFNDECLKPSTRKEKKPRKMSIADMCSSAEDGLSENETKNYKF